MQSICVLEDECCIGNLCELCFQREINVMGPFGAMVTSVLDAKKWNELSEASTVQGCDKVMRGTAVR